jgi:hypothetical protein
MARTHVVSAEQSVSRYLTLLEEPAMFSDAAGDTARRDFIALAKGYADAELIPASAFRALGVPDDVLFAAGIVEEQRIGGRRVISVPGF